MLIDQSVTDTNSPSFLCRVFDVLEAFKQNRRVLTLSEIMRASGVPKTTAHRILTQLVEVRAVERVGQGYRIGLRMFSVGTCSAQEQIRDIALPHLERLRRVTRQTVHLAVLDDAEVVYLEKLCSTLSPATPAVVGGRLPARMTGVGKALLAFSSDEPTRGVSGLTPELSFTEIRTLREDLGAIRRNGLASDREEAAPGLACWATPIMVGREAVAAISVGFAASAGSGECFGNPLREAGAALRRALAGARLIDPRSTVQM